MVNISISIDLSAIFKSRQAAAIIGNNLAKVGVVGSNPIARSNKANGPLTNGCRVITTGEA
jgi:hypothetical protein